MHPYDLSAISGGVGFAAMFTAMNLHARKWFPKLMKPKTPMTSTELIIGYRVWGYDNGKLRSANRSWDWPFRKPLVKDKIENLGIHAIKNGANVPQLFSSYNARVAGEVYLWGVVDECTEGYLAEFAYPKELWMPEDTDPMLIMELEENYGVPVKLRSDLVRHQTPDTWLSPLYSLNPPFTIAANQALYQQANVAMQAQMQAMTNAQLDMLKYGTVQPIMVNPGKSIQFFQYDKIQSPGQP